MGQGAKDTDASCFSSRCLYLSLRNGTTSSTCLGLGQSSVHPPPQCSSWGVHIDTEFSGMQTHVLSWSGSLCQGAYAGAAVLFLRHRSQLSSAHLTQSSPWAPPCSDLGHCPGGATQKDGSESWFTDWEQWWLKGLVTSPCRSRGSQAFIFNKIAGEPNWVVSW